MAANNRVQKSAIRILFKTGDSTYLEQIVVLSGEGADLPSRIKSYTHGLLELNPAWDHIGDYLGSKTPELNEIADGAVVWHVYYESDLDVEQYLEQKYSHHS